LPKVKISSHCLIASLTTSTSLEPKRSSARPRFYATTTNLLVGCAFLSSDKCRLCALLSFPWCLIRFSHFFLTILGDNFQHQHLKNHSESTYFKLQPDVMKRVRFVNTVHCSWILKKSLSTEQHYHWKIHE